MQIVELTESAYAEFADRTPQTAFAQLPGALAARARQGVETGYVGLTDADGTVLAAAAVRFQPWKKVFRRAVIAYGPTFREFTPEVAEAFVSGLIAQLKKKRTVLSLRMNPALIRHRYEGEEPGAVSAEVAALDRVVAAHGGRRTERVCGAGQDVQVQHIYVKDLEGMDFPAAVKSMTQPMRTGFNRHGTPGLTVEFLTAEQFPVLQELLDHTADRKDMSDYSASAHRYYRDLMETMPERVFAPVAVLDVPAYLAGIEEELEQNRAKAAELVARREALEAEGKALGKKQRNALNELESRRTVLEDRAAAARRQQAEDGDRIHLAGAFFIAAGHELVYLLSGAYRKYQSYMGVYLIHRQMVEWAVEHGITRYNTFGISGDLSEDAPDAGVLAFKRQFNGRIEEYAGTYDIPVRPFLAARLGA